MKVVITIFCLPFEIDDLEYALNKLRQGARYLSGRVNWHLEVTVATSNQLVNWKRSSLPKSFFFDRLSRLHGISDWCSRHFQTSDSILGSLKQKQFSLERNADAKYFIWLDSDIIFDEITLSIIEDSVLKLDLFHKNFIMTPEIPRIWDRTWDCLVNQNFFDKSYGYQEKNDPFADCGVKGDISLDLVCNAIQNQPKFKFGSGFFACISTSLLRRIGLPKSFGHYGLEDTFIMWAAEKLVNENKLDVRQFKIKNLVVCENYKYRDYSPYLNHLQVINKKDDFKKISQANFSAELSLVS